MVFTGHMTAVDDIIRAVHVSGVDDVIIQVRCVDDVICGVHVTCVDDVIGVGEWCGREKRDGRKQDLEKKKKSLHAVDV